MITVIAGAVASLGLMLYASRFNKSPILVLVFAVWVLSPFVATLWASTVSHRWSAPARAALNAVMVVLALGSVFIYGAVASGQIRAKVGFIFLVVPFASWLLIVAVVSIAASVSGRRSS